ncbi:hypothetical protein [Burkholderia ambifaria]|nr:hypothetical protein [Burkholderia ambifaria]
MSTLATQRRVRAGRVPTPDRRIAGSPDRRIAGPVKRLTPFRRFFVEVHA